MFYSNIQPPYFCKGGGLTHVETVCTRPLILSQTEGPGDESIQLIKRWDKDSHYYVPYTSTCNDDQVIKIRA